MKTAIIVVLLLLLVYFVACRIDRRCRDPFASRRAHEVCQSARDLFEKSQGDAPYRDYKARVPGSDPVLYTDTRRLWREGQLTPDGVEKVL